MIKLAKKFQIIFKMIWNLYICNHNKTPVLILQDKYQCESSSVGRARPCQGRGREFESRLSLYKKSLPNGRLFL